MMIMTLQDIKCELLSMISPENRTWDQEIDIYCHENDIDPKSIDLTDREIDGIFSYSDLELAIECSLIRSRNGDKTKEEILKLYCWLNDEEDPDEWQIFTDDEADRECADRITEDLWAFNADFWLGFTNLDATPQVIASMREMQGQLCESANPIVRSLVGDELPKLIDYAVYCDGRGHFLSSWDGEEVEFMNHFLYKN